MTGASPRRRMAEGAIEETEWGSRRRWNLWLHGVRVHECATADAMEERRGEEGGGGWSQKPRNPQSTENVAMGVDTLRSCSRV
jgi:hypothetical protein